MSEFIKILLSLSVSGALLLLLILGLPQSPALVFPGLEIRLHQRRVLKDGTDIYCTVTFIIGNLYIKSYTLSRGTDFNSLYLMLPDVYEMTCKQMAA